MGLTTAACLAELGHQITLVEVDPLRVQRLQRGECPFYEPGLDQLLQRHLGGAIRLSGALTDALEGSSLLFICVGTPPRSSGGPDLTALNQLLSTLRSAQPGREPRPVVVLKSTVPPGTNRRAQQLLGRRYAVVSNPEFLREGTAIADFFHPDRIVVGADDPAAAEAVLGLYDGIEAPRLTTSWEEAELVKYLANAFLALKVSFANEAAALCEAMGAEAQSVLRGVGLDARIGSRFLAPGPGFGGSCLPKDLSALRWKARRLRVRLDLLPAALQANRRQRRRVVAKLGDVAGRRVAVWGLAFKAGTDDVREAASLEVIPALLAAGAQVVAHDPEALESFARTLAPEQQAGLQLVEDQWAALQGADALLILTEWEQYRTDPPAIREAMAGTLVVDARNLLDPAAVRAAGLTYRGIGR